MFLLVPTGDPPSLRFGHPDVTTEDTIPPPACKTLDLGSVGAGLGARYRHNELEGEGAVAFSVFCWLRQTCFVRLAPTHFLRAVAGDPPSLRFGHPEGASGKYARTAPHPDVTAEDTIPSTS